MTAPVTAQSYAARTVAVYVLDPLTGIPVELVPDTVPGISPLRWTADILDSDNMTANYTPTTNPVAGLKDITSQVRLELKQLAITGTLIEELPTSLINTGQRWDVLRLQNIVTIADNKTPVLVKTPQHVLPVGIITGISDNWTPDSDASLTVSITVQELRIVRPQGSPVLLPDTSQLPGNYANVNGGKITPQPVTGTSVPATSPIGAPTVI